MCDNRTLGELGSFIRGRGGTKADEVRNGVPCVRYGELYTEHDCVIRNFASFIDERAAHKYTPLRRGDIIFAASGETHEEIGKAAVFLGEETAYASGDTVIFRSGGEADPRFLGYAVNREEASRFKARFGQGSSVIHIKSSHLQHLPIYLPPPAEQRRIGEVLDTLDETIQASEKLIAKLELTQKGLLQDLLTRGLDERGELRDPERNSGQFKEYPWGRIPATWVVLPLENVCGHITKGATPTTYGFSWLKEGIPFLRSECVRDGSFSLEGAEHVSDAAHRSMARSSIEGGDILMTITGYVGRSCVYPVGLPEANINQHIARIRVRDTSIADPRWVAHALRDERQHRRLLQDLTGLAYPQISLAQVRDIPLPLPPLEEQSAIVRVLTNAGERLASERTSLNKLIQIKQGLSSDLLTGRVRTHTMEEALP